MNIIPAVDVLDGRVVRLLKGDFDEVTTYGTDPVATATRWIASGASLVHVVDLDAARTGRPDTRLWSRLVAAGVEFQMGGGIRDVPTALSAIRCGIARIVVGSAIVNDPVMLTAIVSAIGSERVVAAVDVRKGRARGSGWKDAGIDLDEAIRRVVSAGPGSLLVTGIEADGAMIGPDRVLLARVRDLAPDLSLIASGGVADLDDLKVLEDMGCASVVVGRALYDEKISLEDAAAHGFLNP